MHLFITRELLPVNEQLNQFVDWDFGASRASVVFSLTGKISCDIAECLVLIAIREGLFKLLLVFSIQIKSESHLLVIS